MVTPVPHRSRARAFRGGAPAEIGLAVRRRTWQEDEPSVPTHFLCPISLELMRDPVTAPTGITYDRASVEGWLDRGHSTCPVTARPLRPEDLVPNHATRRVIQDWCVANRAHGVDRVPTPRVPVSASDASELLAAVFAAARRADGPSCRGLVARARALAKESDRNRRCLASAGAARALSSAFSRLAAEHVIPSTALEEILAALAMFLPLDQDSMRRIAARASLDSVVSILSHGEPPARASAAVVLREIASSDAQSLDAISKTNGIHPALVSLLTSKPHPHATKAALVTAYYLVAAAAAAHTDAGTELVGLGSVRLLVDADRGTAEKALALLDSLLLTRKGRGEARAVQALAVPVIVRKMMHVSDMATEFAVSALWRLCKDDDLSSASEDDSDGCCKCRDEALQVGAFQKLLLLLQVGCQGVTKDRASELLRILNGSRDEAECIDTLDFKGLKRPF